MAALALCGALVAGLPSGCVSTYQAREAERSGFLGNYSQMRPGKEGEALLVYKNPKANFKAYSKVMVDPVRAYASRESGVANVPKADLQAMVNYLSATLREKLKADYELVNAPGPGVLRVRVAITEAKGAKVALDTFSTLMPIGLALSEVKNIATGSHSAVGAIGVECELLDGLNNTRLFAAVDERVGRKITGKFDKFDTWRTAYDAFDFWADRLQTRLRAERH
jgi:hypothetical protein